MDESHVDTHLQTVNSNATSKTLQGHLSNIPLVCAQVLQKYYFSILPLFAVHFLNSANKKCLVSDLSTTD